MIRSKIWKALWYCESDMESIKEFRWNLDKIVKKYTEYALTCKDKWESSKKLTQLLAWDKDNEQI